MRRIFALLVILAFLPGFVQPVRAQSAVALQNVGVTYTFGGQVTFSAKVQTQASIQAAYLLFQVENEQNTRIIPLAIAADGTAVYQYSAQNGLLRPFSRVNFWYQLLLSGGGKFDSQHYSFQYNDNRYPWQTLEGSGLRLHWYAGDVSFGQAALDAAQSGYQAIQAVLPVPAGDPIDIYVYASSTDVQNTLNLGGATWVGGHASPDLGVVLVSIAPGETQGIEMERQIPHELAHVVLYRLTGAAAYANLPNWFSEGFASNMEQYPDADYTQVLTVSTRNQALIPMADLCGPFPTDASGAILAYAESNSFVRYLHETYGTSSLQALIQAYTDGLTCDQGVTRAIGLPLAQLDLQWRQAALGEKVAGLAFQNLLPFLVLLVFMLIIPLWRITFKRQKQEPYPKQEQHDGKKPQ
ncbi:MAG: peptidase MA family metallohydrolase [Anaerolineales bacterium]